MCQPQLAGLNKAYWQKTVASSVSLLSGPTDKGTIRALAQFLVHAPKPQRKPVPPSLQTSILYIIASFSRCYCEQVPKIVFVNKSREHNMNYRTGYHVESLGTCFWESSYTTKLGLWAISCLAPSSHLFLPSKESGCFSPGCVFIYIFLTQLYIYSWQLFGSFLHP